MLEWILVLGEMQAGAAEVEYVHTVSAPPSSFPPTLLDVASRLPLDTQMRDPDLVTYAHEGNHGLCRGRPGFHGVYVGQGIRIFIPTPPLVTEEVFNAVPEPERGPIWKTYRDQGRTEYWSTQPLMLLDEWAAYLAGSMTRRELRLDVRRETEVYCAEMAGYAHRMYVMAKAIPTYPIKDLREFCLYQSERCRRTIPDWGTLFTKKFD